MFRRGFVSVPLSLAAVCAQCRRNANAPLATPSSTSVPLAKEALASAMQLPPEGVQSVQVTTMPNGARVISQDVGGAVASIAAYCLAGPAFEPIGCPGVGAMLQAAFATQSSPGKESHPNQIAGMEALPLKMHKYYVSAHVSCRRDAWYAYNLSHSTAAERAKMKSKKLWLSSKASPIRDVVLATLSNPPLQEEVIKHLGSAADARLKELRWHQPIAYAKIALETIAFYLEPLGSPRYVPVSNAANLTAEVLQAQYDRYATPPRMILAGVNVDHDALLAEYENAFPQTLPSSAASQPARGGETNGDIRAEARQYTGGEQHDHEDRAKVICTKPFMDTETICAVGWLTYGHDRTQLRQYTAALVAKALLDVVLTSNLRYNTDEAGAQNPVRAFYTPFQTAGLLGLTLTAEPTQAAKILLDAVRLVREMRNPPLEAVNVAKLNAKIYFLNENTATVQDYCDFLCNSLPMMSDSTMVTSLDEILQDIEFVSVTDVKNVIDMMLSYPTSFYGHGEMLGFPSIRQMGL